MPLLINLLLDTIAVVVLSYLLTGISVENFVSALFVAILIGFFGVTVKPLLQLLTLPINLLTFGLFSFVISALLILLVDFLHPGFQVENFLWALLFAFLYSVFSSFLRNLVK